MYENRFTRSKVRGFIYRNELRKDSQRERFGIIYITRKSSCHCIFWAWENETQLNNLLADGHIPLLSCPLAARDRLSTFTTSMQFLTRSQCSMSSQVNVFTPPSCRAFALIFHYRNYKLKGCSGCGSAGGGRRNARVEVLLTLAAPSLSLLSSSTVPLPSPWHHFNLLKASMVSGCSGPSRLV